MHGQVVGSVQGCALAQSDGVHAAEFLQPVPEDEGTGYIVEDIGADVEDVLGIVPERSLDHGPYL